MPSVQRLGHVAIRVEDVKRAVAFYTGLGMRLVWEAEDWCYLEAGPGRDGLALLGPGYKAAGPHFAFHFQDRAEVDTCLLYTSPSPRDRQKSRMPSSA